MNNSKLNTFRILNHLILILGFVFVTQLAAETHEAIYPAGDGFVIDITQPPFNADPTGQEDISEILFDAVTEARRWPFSVPAFVYFPNGIYRIEKPVVLDERTPGGGYLMLQGQSREGVTLYVPDNSPEFQDAENPKSMISYFEGDWTNNGFLNTFENFTIEIGAGNPGAIGLRFQGNNVTRMENVTIRSMDPDRVGAVGLDLSPSISAPAIVENVRIEGFDVGVKMDNTITSVYSWVLKDIELYYQRAYGFVSYRKPVTVFNLTSVNSVPVVNSLFRDGNWLIFNAELSTPEGQTVDGPAIIGNGDFFYLRNVAQTGYAHLMNDNGVIVDATGADGSYRNGPAYKVWEDSPEDFLHLPIVDFPEVPMDHPDDWYIVDSTLQGDDTEALRAAMISGAETIYLKPGVFNVSETIRIGPNVKRITSNFAQIHIQAPLVTREAPVFELGRSNHEAVIIERIWGNWQQNISNYMLHNRSNADLILRDIFWISGGVYRNDPATGRLFVSNVHNVPGGQQFRPGFPSWVIRNQDTWAFQFNPEMALPMLTVDGGRFWAFGAKFGEQQGPMIYAFNQAKVEMLGGVMNVSHGVDLVPFDTAIFHIEDSQVTASVVERAGEINGPPNWNFRHRFISDEWRDGERVRLSTRDPMVVHRDTLSRNGPGEGGAMIPLYTSRYSLDLQGSNLAPEVRLYVNRSPGLATGAYLLAEVNDMDGPGKVSTHWKSIDGPGEVIFSDPSSPFTHAHFTHAGTYEIGFRAFDGLAETVDSLIVEVGVTGMMQLPIARAQFKRLSDNAPRNGMADSAAEALFLQTGDIATAQAQDTEVRIHTEVDIYRLRGSENLIESAYLEVTPRALSNPLDIDLYSITVPVFGMVGREHFGLSAAWVETVEAAEFEVNKTVSFDLTTALVETLSGGNHYLGLQLRSTPNDNNESNFVEWYSPDVTVAEAYRPKLIVHFATGESNILDDFLEMGGDILYHPEWGYYQEFPGTNWLWSQDLELFFHLASNRASEAWLWNIESGWLWTRISHYPWMYRHDTESWHYALGGGYFYDTKTGNWTNWK